MRLQTNWFEAFLCFYKMAMAEPYLFSFGVGLLIISISDIGYYTAYVQKPIHIVQVSLLFLYYTSEMSDKRKQICFRKEEVIEKLSIHIELADF